MQISERSKQELNILSNLPIPEYKLKGTAAPSNVMNMTAKYVAKLTKHTIFQQSKKTTPILQQSNNKM